LRHQIGPARTDFLHSDLRKNIAKPLPRTYYREYRDPLHTSSPGAHDRAKQAALYNDHDLYNIKQSSVKAEKHAMADDDIEDSDCDSDSDFDDDCDEQEDIEYADSSPADSPSKNARRELEKRLEMKRLREMRDSDEFEVDF
jgi:hypothetical protein